MLKHCSPSCVDVGRRSRRHLIQGALSPCDSQIQYLDLDGDSEQSFSSSCSSPSGRPDCGKCDEQQHTDMAIKVYARCLRSDIEYKTLIVSNTTTSKQVIWSLLSKYRMKYRDPKLFYLTMDIHVKRTGVPLCRSIVLDEEARPAELKSCHPWGESRFTLRMRKGGLVRIYDSILMAESKYKCLLVSEQTTVDEVLNLLLRCYSNSPEKRGQIFCLYEHTSSSPDPATGRKMQPDEQPVQVQNQWPFPSECRFVLGLEPDCHSSGYDHHHHLIHRSFVITDYDSGQKCYSSNSSSSPDNCDLSALRLCQQSPVSSTSSRSSGVSSDSGLMLGQSSSSVSSSSGPNFSRPRRRHSPHSPLPITTASSSSSATKTASAASTLINSCAGSPRPSSMDLHYSLHSLLDSLPSECVDLDGAVKVKMPSLYSLSSHSSGSEVDGFFYI